MIGRVPYVWRRRWVWPESYAARERSVSDKFCGRIRVPLAREAKVCFLSGDAHRRFFNKCKTPFGRILVLFNFNALCDPSIRVKWHPRASYDSLGR